MAIRHGFPFGCVGSNQLCVKHRKQVLANEAILMPDHLHVVVAASKGDSRFGNFPAAMKRWMRKELNASWDWQRLL